MFFQFLKKIMTILRDLIEDSNSAMMYSTLLWHHVDAMVSSFKTPEVRQPTKIPYQNAGIFDPKFQHRIKDSKIQIPGWSSVCLGLRRTKNHTSRQNGQNCDLYIKLNDFFSSFL